MLKHVPLLLLCCISLSCGSKAPPPEPTLSVVGRDMLWRDHMDAGVKADAGKNHAEAEREFKAAAAEAETFGPHDRRLATSLNQLAQHYADRDEFAKAEPLFKQAVGIWEQASGPEHRNVIPPLWNLAAMYQRQGKLAEAEPLYQRCLHICDKTPRANDHDLARSLHNLAQLYVDQTKYAE